MKFFFRKKQKSVKKQRLNVMRFIFRRKQKSGKKQELTGKVSILIPTMFDSKYILDLCIKSMIKNTIYPNYQIIVCDCGLDEQSQKYLQDLKEKKTIKLIKAIDIERPKDDLVKAVDSEYYIIMHDDIRILKKGWLRRRLELLARDEHNAVVGSIKDNEFSKNRNSRRFFPLGLLVKTEVSKKLNLVWGSQGKFNTGAVAYNKFFAQRKYKFVPHRFSKDIFHFSEMTWPKMHLSRGNLYPGLAERLRKRREKLKRIKKILAKKAY
ncbi:glycosyltransferase family 2 protein [Candidatus Omnitrophota bacterium]